MLRAIKTLRPVGGHISYTPTTWEFDCKNSPFSPYMVNFYSSGTASLATAILASIRSRPEVNKPEVILPAYGCPDLISATIFAGAQPVLVDLMPNSLFMDVEQLHRSLSAQTTAIVAVRFFGIPERNQQLKEIAHKHSLTFIEDSAQGLPSHNVGTYWDGDYIILSFGRGKPLNLLGGGAVLSSSDEKQELLSSLPIVKQSTLEKLRFSYKVKVYNKVIHPWIYGLISRTPGLHIGQTIFKPLDEIRGIDESHLDIFTNNYRNYKKQNNQQAKWKSLITSLKSDNVVDVPSLLDHDISQPLLRYPILLNDKTLRDKLHEQLSGLGASLMYQLPLNKIPGVMQHLKNGSDEFKNANNIADRLLTLPNHEGVSEEVFNKYQTIFNDIC